MLRKRTRVRARIGLMAILALCAIRDADAVNIQFDYTYAAGTFIGSTALGVHGAPVPLADTGHFADDFFTPEPAMDPVITTGTRKLMTALDYAAMAAIGWEVPLALLPEPDTGVLVAAALVLLVGVASTRRSAPPRRAVGPRPPPAAAATPPERPRSKGWAPARG
jgi:hypothetical protein